MSQTDNPLFRQPRRPRRLRHTQALREMLRDVHLASDDLIWPVFVTHGRSVKAPIESMPGQFQLSLDMLDEAVDEAVELGIRAVLLFGIPEHKDSVGSGAGSDRGIIQLAIRQLKVRHPELVVVADTCLCEYTDHGHCGLLNQSAATGLPTGYVMNDETNEVLASVAVSQARAGADVIAPSGMMDGMVTAIRTGLDAAGFQHIPVMAYSVKYASSYYGPFREAAQGAPRFGDRRTHQMDPANLQQAFVEAELDVEQGADMMIVKPALAYLDIICRLRERHPGIPLVAYNVSGEYAMIRAAAINGWINEREIVLETMTGIKRAGADLIITYHAKDICRWLKM